MPFQPNAFYKINALRECTPALALPAGAPGAARRTRGVNIQGTSNLRVTIEVLSGNAPMLARIVRRVNTTDAYENAGIEFAVGLFEDRLIPDVAAGLVALQIRCDGAGGPNVVKITLTAAS